MHYVFSLARKEGELDQGERQLEGFLRLFPCRCVARSEPAAQSSNMREIVHIQAGQCGNQIGAKFWEVCSIARSCGLAFKTLQSAAIVLALVHQWRLCSTFVHSCVAADRTAHLPFP